MTGAFAGSAMQDTVPIVPLSLGRLTGETMTTLENRPNTALLVVDVHPDAAEPLVEKTYGDSFEATALETVLSDLGVGRLVVVGAQTDACIRSTLHGALVRGYDATLVSDAHTTEDNTQSGAPPPDQVIAHTNLYWADETVPGRTAGAVATRDVDLAARPDAYVTRMPVERYLRLGLRLGRHVEGIVDAYYGPPELAAAVDAEPPVDPRALVTEAEALLGELEDGWLRDQVGGLRTYAGVLAGESGSYADEVEGCYGVRPAHTDEAVFAAAHERLDELLPGHGTLAERHERWKGTSLVPADQIERLMATVIEKARAWTGGLVDLPDGEDVAVEIVRDEPWMAFCSTSAGSRPGLRQRRPAAVRHRPARPRDPRTYPGHHAERACKEHLLVRGRGLLEETLVLVPAPQSLVSEGIAVLAPQMLLGSEGASALAAVMRDAGIEFDLADAFADRAGPRAVPVGPGERGLDAARRQSERGRDAGLSRALGTDDPAALRAHDPVLQRPDLAHLHHHVPRRARALPLVRGRRAGALPPPADRAGARP